MGTSPGKLDALLNKHLAKFWLENTRSSAINKKAAPVLPGGTSRAVLYNDPFPIALKGGRGPYLTSEDGDEYLDLVSEYCAAMVGHSHPDIVAAIHAVADAGFMLGGPTASEAELAQLLVDRIPSYEAVRFCNSGTEANTMAIAAALAYTGRKKVREGCRPPRPDKSLNNRRSRSSSLRTRTTAARSSSQSPTP